MWYYLTSEGSRAKLVRAPAPVDGDERTDEARALDGHEGYAVAFALPRAPHDFEYIDLGSGALALDVAALDAHLHGLVDAEAGAFRCRFITVVPGQEMTYLRKEAEARDLLASGAGPWPMLAATAAALDQPIAELAQEIVKRSDEWTALGAGIEALRLGAKAAVTAAADAETKRNAAEVDWEALLDPDKPLPPQGGQKQGTRA